MKRRLYYLFPDAPHAETLNQELSALAIQDLSLHAMVDKQTELAGDEDIHQLTETDRDYFLEWWLWRINLAVFFLALLVLIGMSVFSPSIYMLMPLLIMAVCFAMGLLFTLRMPNVHLSEFNHAVHHGEVLMMVDVPAAELTKVDHHIHRLHPEAVSGGVGWAA